jgi:uncharacterized membrane protein
MATSRIEALCDGIFAVVMTLLVLGITVPHATSVPPERLAAALRKLGPEFVAYAVSFVNVGVL